MTFKNIAKMYCKKNPIKVVMTVGVAIVAGPILGIGVIGTIAVGIGGFFIGKKIEDKKNSE